MGLLKLLGIEKYLKKVKTYVDEKANELDGRINNIKPDAPTPDWNAGQGQDGHILNRTHYAVGQFFELHAYANGDEEIAYDLDGNYRDLMLVKLEKDGSSVEFTVTMGEEKTVAIGAKEVRFYYASSTEAYVYGENLGDIRCFIHDTVVSEESYRQSFRQLDEKFIPDTIARKSDIPSVPSAPAVDETLMKYLANPYKIRLGSPIPQDLHDLIFDSGFKPVTMSVCVFYEDAESKMYRIEAVGEWEIFAYGQQLSYDDLERTFNY